LRSDELRCGFKSDMKSLILKVNWYLKIAQYSALVVVKVAVYLVLHTKYFFFMY